MHVPRFFTLLAVLVAHTTAFVVPAVPPHRRQMRSSVRLMADVAEGIQAQIQARMKAAMKKGADGKQELGAVRLIISAMTTKQKEDGLEALNDDMAIAVLTKLAKMRKESIDMFSKAGAEDKAEAERFELRLLEEYLPEQAGEEDVKAWIAEAIAEVCPDGPSMKLMGKVMGALNKAHGGEFDNKDASVWVKEMLNA